MNTEFTKLEQRIIKDMSAAIKLIKQSGIKYIEFGLFGSVARGEYNTLSDIDIVILVNEIPDKYAIAKLRAALDDNHCDLAFMLIKNFENPSTLFHKEVKRDYRRIYLNEQNVSRDC